MSDISLSRDDLPFLLSGAGTITIRANVSHPAEPLPLADHDLVTVDFGAKGDSAFLFGLPNAITVGVSAGMTSRLMVISSGTTTPNRLALLKAHGLAGFFATHPDQLILAFTLDASSEVKAGTTFIYEPLTAKGNIAAGASSDLVYLRPYPVQRPAEEVLKDYVGHLRLPAHLTTDLPLGEVISFSFGGYLSVGGSLALGYQIKGAPSAAIKDLQLSEHYGFSVAASVGFAARLAGEFDVEARAAVDASGAASPGWVRIIVRKKRNAMLKIAADAGVKLDTELRGLPGTADEFLGALLGVRVRNWLNVVSDIRELSDWDALEKQLDDLAKQFVGAWVGKAAHALNQTDLPVILAKVTLVVDSYEDLEDTAITLFDRYFSQIDALTAVLKELATLTSLEGLKPIVDRSVGPLGGTIWEVVQILTDGDPLGWALGHITVKDEDGHPVEVPSLQEFLERVQDTLDLIEKDAHEAIRQLIALAKDQFDLDDLVDAASKLDSVDKLKKAADAKALAFIERLIGVGIDDLKQHAKIEAIRQRLHDTLVAVQTFEDRVYAKFRDAMTQSLSFDMHAVYNRASETESLLDLDINVTTPAGLDLLQKAGHGEFHDVVSGFRPDLVRLREGSLSHKLTKSTALTVNILGWHSGWHYQGVDKLIVATDQHLVTESNGGLTAYTTIDMTKDRERQRQDESAKAHLVLRFLGESHGVLKLDTSNQQYLIDSITSGSVSYTLAFADAHTPLARLKYFLGFAQAFGLTDGGANVDALLPYLQRADPAADDFGEIGVSYQVRYTDAGLRRLFAAHLDPEACRQTLRQIIWAHYIRDASTSDIAWGYVFPSVHESWLTEGRFRTSLASLRFPANGSAAPVDGFVVPSGVSLDRTKRGLLDVLFQVEEKILTTLSSFDAMIHGHEIDPATFERRLSDLGDALRAIDGIDGDVNGLFAVMDRLIQQQSPNGDARLSSMTLTSVVNKEKRTKVILSGKA